jgi:membrane protein implicated in regulation of membrane protease activity
MNPPEGPNPEHRSNNALLCFCIGAGLAGIAYLLGVGAVISAAFGAGDAAVIAGSMIAAIGLTLAALSGFILMAIGAIWMLGRVIADQRGDDSEKRYRDVER